MKTIKNVASKLDYSGLFWHSKTKPKLLVLGYSGWRFSYKCGPNLFDQVKPYIDVLETMRGI